MKLNEEKMPFDTVLRMACVDALNWLKWSKTRDAEKGRNMPKSLLQELMWIGDKKETITAFDSAADFERRKAEIIGGNRNADIR